jgi:sulfoxide reductase heme-binding subunit YedZ
MCFVLCATPALWLGLAAAVDTLGANPLEKLLRVSGRTALWLLILTLAIGPLLQLGSHVAQWAQARYGRRLSDWNALIALRRQLGLCAFFYAALHTALYLALDAGFDWREVLEDLRERHVAAGWGALLLLLPMAATSNAAAKRWLGARWQRLHLLGYFAVAAATLHLTLQAKVMLLMPWLELLAVALLVAWRLREAGLGRAEPLQEVRLRLRRWRRSARAGQQPGPPN